MVAPGGANQNEFHNKTMRKITVISMITMDGVMQAPGGPEEDISGGFKYGGWVAPYHDDISGEIIEKLMKPADLLLGRKTFEIWENYWPQHESAWPGINEVTKYVFSQTRTTSAWENSVFLKRHEDIENLRNTKGDPIQVWGSGELIQLLLAHDLVDELWLIIHPLTLGNGKNLFAGGSIPAAFTLAESTVTPKGVIVTNYKRAGEVRTGTVSV